METRFEWLLDLANGKEARTILYVRLAVGVDSGLSVQPSDAKGSGWCSRLRPNGEPVEAFPSMRDEARGERAELAFSF
jgi:hypothetical protein